MAIKRSGDDMILSFIKDGQPIGFSVVKNYASFEGALMIDDSENFLLEDLSAYRYDYEYGILNRLEDDEAQSVLLAGRSDTIEYEQPIR